MYQKLRVRHLAWVALTWGAMVAASATAFAQLTLQGSVPIGDPNDPMHLPGAPRNDPRYLGISTFGGTPKAWIADYGHGGVDVLNLAFVPATRIAFLPAPSGFSHAIAVDTKETAVAVTFYDPANGSHVTVYNATNPTGPPLADFDVGLPGSGSILEGVAIVDNTILVVTDKAANSVQSWFYAGPNEGNANGAPAFTNDPAIQDGPAYGPTDVKIVTRGAARIAVVVESVSDRIQVFPLRPNGSVNGGRRSVPTGQGPTRMWVDPTSRAIFVANSIDDTVTVVGPSLSPVVQTLTTSINGPAGITGSTDVSGNLHIYVANRNSRQLAYYSGPIVSLSAPAFVTVLNVSRAPLGAASQFGLPIGAPPNPPGFGDRILLTSLADDTVDDLGR